jgi:hypothetical protein
MFANAHNGKIFRAQGSALAVLGVRLVLSSLLYFRAQGLKEPAEYEPRLEVQSSSWGHAPRLEKAWARSATDWFPSLYVHSLIGSSVHHISTGVYLKGWRRWIRRHSTLGVSIESNPQRDHRRCLG